MQRFDRSWIPPLSFMMLLAGAFFLATELNAARSAIADSLPGRAITLSFDSVAPIQPDNRISGRVMLWVSVSATVEDDVREIELRMDGAMICEQKFSAPLGSTQGKARISCPIDTTARAPRGARFPNGKHILSAVALNAAGAQIAADDYPEIIIDNRD